MRTRSEIKKLLKNSLTSSSWKKLLNAVIGKELLSWGTEVIYTNELIAEDLAKSNNPDICTFPDLIRLSNQYDIPVTKTKPSWIRVQLAEGNNVYKPFELRYVSGTSTFTNINYCGDGDVVTLYQGNVVSLIDDSTLTTKDFMNFRVDSSKDLIMSTISTVDNDSFLIYNLENAFPKSVYYLKRETQGTGYVVTALTKLTPELYSPSVEGYRLYTLPDGNIALRLGDGVWAKEPNSTGYQVVYLTPSTSEFSLDGRLESSTNSNMEFTILASENGSETIQYAREQFSSAIIGNKVLSTIQEIKSFVKSFESVLDCKVKYSFINNDPTIQVFIKPTDITEEGPSYNKYPGEIYLALESRMLNGISLFMNIGNSIQVQFQVKGVNSKELQLQIKDRIQAKFAYEKVSYEQIISVLDVSSLIQSEYGLNTEVKYVVNTTLNAKQPFKINKGTVQVTDSSGVVVAWDSNGYLIGKGNSTLLGSSRSLGLGNCVTFGFCGYLTDNSKLVSALDQKIKDVDTLYFRSINEDLKNIFGVDSLPYVEILDSNSKYAFILKSYKDAVPTIAVIEQELIKSYPEGYPGSITAERVFSHSLSNIIEGNSINYSEYMPWLGYSENLFYYLDSTRSRINFTQIMSDSEISYNYFSLPIQNPSNAKPVGLISQEDTIYVILNNYTIVAISNYLSTNIEQQTIPLSISHEAGDTLKVYNGYNSSILFLLTGSDGSTKFFIGRGIRLNGTFDSLQKVELEVSLFRGTELNVSVPEITEGTITSCEFMPSFVSDKYLFIAGTCILKNGNAIGVSDFNFTFDLETGKLVDKSESFDVSTCGSVNYNTGEIKYTGSASNVIVNFESDSVSNIDSDSFVMLNPTNPLIWK